MLECQVATFWMFLQVGGHRDDDDDDDDDNDDDDDDCEGDKKIIVMTIKVHPI